MSDKRIVPTKDMRGAHPAINKIGPEIEEKVRTHIFKFGPSVCSRTTFHQNLIAV